MLDWKNRWYIGIREVLMTEKRKSIRALAEELKAIRKRPVPREKIDKFNKTMEEEERLQREEKKRGGGDKKIARPPEAEA